jgi:hypothetical protein
METAEVVLAVVLGLVVFWMGWQANGLAKMRSLIYQIAEAVRTLLKWHSPDNSGRQEWKNPGVIECLETLTEEMRGLRQDLRDQYAQCMECRKNMTSLQNQLIELQRNKT